MVAPNGATMSLGSSSDMSSPHNRASSVIAANLISLYSCLCVKQGCLQALWLGMKELICCEMLSFPYNTQLSPAVVCPALGAIGVAAVGVYGVLQLSLMVAQGTGRSIMADKQKLEAEQQARSQPPG